MYTLGQNQSTVASKSPPALPAAVLQFIDDGKAKKHTATHLAGSYQSLQSSWKTHLALRQGRKIGNGKGKKPLTLGPSPPFLLSVKTLQYNWQAKITYREKVCVSNEDVNNILTMLTYHISVISAPLSWSPPATSRHVALFEYVSQSSMLQQSQGLRVWYIWSVSGTY